MHPVRIGCSGWQYDDWRGVVYPPGTAKARWLGAYAERFDTVEVNSTFYRLASKPAVARWVEDTPAGFLFTIKASRYLTHMKRLKDLGSGIGRFYERIEPLVEAKRLGPVVWQLPESFQRDDDLLADALDQLPPGRHCFEFRHPSWFAPDVEAILREHRVALVIADHPEDRPPAPSPSDTFVEPSVAKTRTTVTSTRKEPRRSISRATGAVRTPTSTVSTTTETASPATTRLERSEFVAFDLGLLSRPASWSTQTLRDAPLPMNWLRLRSLPRWTCDQETTGRSFARVIAT